MEHDSISSRKVWSAKRHPCIELQHKQAKSKVLPNISTLQVFTCL
jgi:hypothetical protein